MKIQHNDSDCDLCALTSSSLFAAYFIDDQYIDSLEAVTLTDGSTAYIQRNAQDTKALSALGSNTEDISFTLCKMNHNKCFKPIMLFSLLKMGVYWRGRFSSWMMGLLLIFSMYIMEVCV